MKFVSVFVFLLFASALGSVRIAAQASSADKAEAVLQKAVQNLGGEKYLKVTSVVGRGKYSIIRDGAVISFQSFIDVIVFPDKERSEFKGGGSKNVQTNVGGGGWRNDAELSYVGRRAGTLGKRNDVIRLTYKDGFAIEFEIADDGTPVKSLYKRKSAGGEDIAEEDRYAQFVDVGGIKAPFIIDRFSAGRPNSRINYDTVEYNRPIPDKIFAKPGSPKELKKDLQL
jgi:hypothetical protein